jgi:hypothetical protein
VFGEIVSGIWVDSLEPDVRECLLWVGERHWDAAQTCWLHQHTGLTRYFDFYNLRRIHQSHDYRTSDEIYYAANANEPLAISA